uniref:Immunoglobulin V-set domain-containing protein n=1 Tax=Myripristis murdjan TaxID=586833 RepID=A0A667WYF3_9TELE
MMTFSLFAGVWSEIRLDQTPSQVKRPGDTVKMSCTMSGFDMTSYYIHWVRQRPGKALEWIGRMDAGSNSLSLDLFDNNLLSYKIHFCEELSFNYLLSFILVWYWSIVLMI